MHENSPERKRGALSVISTLYCIKSQRNLIGPCYGMYCNAQANCCLFSDLIKSLCCRHWPYRTILTFPRPIHCLAIVFAASRYYCYWRLPCFAQPAFQKCCFQTKWHNLLSVNSSKCLQNVHVNAKISPWCELNPHKCKKITLVWITSHLDGKVDVQLEVQP